jgi:hypothetical protein
MQDKLADGPLHKVARGGCRGSTYASYFADKSPFLLMTDHDNGDDDGSGSVASKRHAAAGGNRLVVTNKGQLSVLKFLLRKNCSDYLRLNGRNKQGDTPLTLVCANCSKEDAGHDHSLVVLLTHAGADPFSVNSKGKIIYIVTVDATIVDVVGVDAVLILRLMLMLCVSPMI